MILTRYDIREVIEQFHPDVVEPGDRAILLVEMMQVLRRVPEAVSDASGHGTYCPPAPYCHIVTFHPESKSRSSASPSGLRARQSPTLGA